MKKRYILWMLFLTFVFSPITGQAEEKSVDPLERMEQVYEENGGNATGFSLREEVEKILSGETEFSPSDLLHSFLDQVSKQWNEQKSDFIKLLILGILTGFCANLSQTLGDEGLGAVSFYVIYGVLCSIVLAGFRQVYDLAQEGVEGVFSFAGALVHSFALALGISGSSTAALGYYETMLIVISVMQWGLKSIFLPLIEIYFMLKILEPVTKGRFLRLAGLCKSLVTLGLKGILTVVLGYQGLQGLILPVMDQVKNNGILTAAKSVPGVGNLVGGAAQTLVGSTMLIKSAIGVGGVIGFVCVVFYPLLKMGIFTCFYKVAQALVQPVSSGGFCVAVAAAGECGKLLFQCLFYSTILFSLAILILLLATNLL